MEKEFRIQDEALLAANIVYEPSGKNHKEKYDDAKREFQGIPGVERTKGGKLYYTFYSGTQGEGSGNFVMLYRSETSVPAEICTEGFRPILVIEAPTEMTRTFDPCLWMDDLGRLWLFYAQSYTHIDGRFGVWAIRCDDPDAEKPVFTEPRRLANGIMMNKPIVLENGNWLLCCSIWNVYPSPYNNLPEEQYSNVYMSDDKGQTFRLIGHADYINRSTDENMAVQLSDGRLWMLIRAKTGIGQAFSADGGYTWEGESDSGLGGPSSRFCLRKLKSGNLLLINHHDFRGRNNLKAMLSRDDGKTWEGYLLLDERNDVSYPDMTEDENGNLYIAYDYNRTKEKELYLAIITEEDILAGKLVKKTSRLRVLVNKATGGNNV